MHSQRGPASYIAITPRSSNRFGRIAASFAMMLVLLLTTSQWALRPATAAEATMLGTAAPTGLVQHSDTNGVEVGTRFTARVNGKATGMRFWKDEDTASTHTGTLWSAEGVKLASATFTKESSSGWQVASFDRAVDLTNDADYVVSYYAPMGRYAATYDVRGESNSTDLSISSGFGVYKYGSNSQLPVNTYRNTSYWVDLVFSPQPVPGADPTLTQDPTTIPTTAPAPAPSAGPSYNYLGRSWPDATTTGVPAATVLAPYSGPCTIQVAGTVIDAKEVNCDLRVLATGVVIKNTLLHGSVYADTDGSGSFTISDSTVSIGDWPGTGIGDAYFIAERVHVTGGTRSINCYMECTVKDSYVHDQMTDPTGVHHESGIRVNTNSRIIHNTIGCTAPNVAPDAGCSAALTSYPDFDPVTGNLVENNLILGDSGGYCTYGGSTTGKPYSGRTRDITFRDNVWQRGSTGRGCWWGPATSFDVSAPGNVWSNNRWDDGAPVAAAN